MPYTLLGTAECSVRDGSGSRMELPAGTGFAWRVSMLNHGGYAMRTNGNRSSARLRWPGLVMVAAAVLVASLPLSAATAGVGIVVESIADTATAPERALVSGDVVTGWRQVAVGQPVAGTLTTPFDWTWLQVERAARGPVELTVERAGKPLTVRLGAGTKGPGLWRVTVRPRLSRRLERTYLAALERARADDVDGALTAWNELARRRAIRLNPLLRAWLEQRRAAVLLAAGRADEAVAALTDAVAAAAAGGSLAAQLALSAELGRGLFRIGEYERGFEVHRASLELVATAAPGTLSHAAALHDLGTMTLVVGDLDGAAELLHQAVALREQLAPAGLALAESYNNLGLADTYAGRFEAAEASHRRALQIRLELVPDTLDLASSYNNLGMVAKERGDLDAAEELYLADLGLSQRLAPGTGDVATTLMNLGAVAWERGDLALAEERFHASLAIVTALDPAGIDVAANLNNLALVAEQRGDLAAADDNLQQALAIWQARTPDSQDVASALLNLGLIAWRRADLDNAQTYLVQARTRLDAIAPDNHTSALVLLMLGDVALDRGDLEAAEDWYRRSLELRERIMPGSAEIASNLINLGAIARRRGDHDAARRLFTAAIERRQASSPGSLFVAHGFQSLGALALEDGDFDGAEAALSQALEIRSRLAPGSSEEATTLYSLGRVSRARGRLAEAAARLERAIEALEAQVGRLGGSNEARAGFRAQFADLYRELIEVQLALERPQDAFSTLERSRAQLFLATLAERDLVFTADLSPDLERRRKQVAWDYDAVLERLAQLDPAAAADEVAAARTRLDELRRERTEVAAAIREASPRLAALQYPQPLDAARAAARLEPGTLVLAYSVGEAASTLFTLSRDGLTVHPLAATSRELRDAVTALRGAIVAGGGDSFAPQAHVPLASRLYDLLVRPAAAELRAAERLVVVPDGPLHALPFAALVSAPGEQRPHYLVDDLPLSVTLSVTVLDELAQRRPTPARDPATWRVVGFGDPLYPQATAGNEPAASRDAAVRSVAGRGFALGPLPATRAEVAALDALWPDTAVTFFGAAATEDQVRTSDTTATVLHFACHGLLDEAFPLESALALTIPEQPTAGAGNGLLQAWEIFEGVRLDADLVTLSACQTALGAELGGEGLVGLTRAFQYAGARTVVATLWSVSDRITAELMAAFYRRLRGGEDVAGALRGAQLEILAGRPDGDSDVRAADPFFWAAFQVIGDWR